jgi:hypothetical protein
MKTNWRIMRQRVENLSKNDNLQQQKEVTIANAFTAQFE